MTESPRLGVLSRSPAPPELVTLLGMARRWCTIVWLAVEAAQAADAVVAVGSDLIPPAPRPLAVWAASVADVERAEMAGAEVVLSIDDEVITRAGRRGLFVPPGGPDVACAVPVAPFVRARLRGARGLPSPYVIEHDGEGWTSAEHAARLPSDLAVTAIGCASAAAVTGPALVDALAWGTPCVTDDASAARFGAEPGHHVLVGASAAARRRLAADVAADGPLAARLSWAGRTLVEARHSPALAAAKLVRRLGLGAATRLPGPLPLAAGMAELGTPERAFIGERAMAATRILQREKD